MKDKIRPIYQELKGMLSQAPVGGYIHESEKSLWERSNQLAEKLVEITKDEDYKSFFINPKYDEHGYTTMSISLYRGKISGLISKLFGSFFSEEAEPFSGSPSTVISQNNNQVVTTQLFVQLGIELKTALEKADSENEKSFINKITEKIGLVKNYIDFLLLTLSTAQAFGIGLDRVLVLFGK